MNKEEVISKVKTLNLPKDSYVIFGSCPMTVAGIREANDIDLIVSKEVYRDLKNKGWKKITKGADDVPLTHDVFEAHYNWNFSAYSPTLLHLLSTATVINEVPFASLDEVRKWKHTSDKPKHIADVKLIDVYLKK